MRRSLFHENEHTCTMGLVSIRTGPLLTFLKCRGTKFGDGSNIIYFLFFMDIFGIYVHFFVNSKIIYFF